MTSDIDDISMPPSCIKLRAFIPEFSSIHRGVANNYGLLAASLLNFVSLLLTYFLM